jgi:hypothetical protein
MKKLIMITAALALVALVTNSAHSADEPTSEEIRAYAFDYMKQFPKDMSDRQIASQLASTIFFLEKIQLVCPSYFYVNANRVRYSYLLRQGTWATMFGPGKTATSILNEVGAKRNEDFNNTISKKEWCERIKAFGTKTFGWGSLFEVGEP